MPTGNQSNSRAGQSGGHFASQSNRQSRGAHAPQPVRSSQHMRNSASRTSVHRVQPVRSAHGSSAHGSAYRSAHSYSQPPQKHNPVPTIIAIIIAIVIVALLSIFVLIPAFDNLFGAGSQDPAVEAGIDVQITIPEGSSGDQIAQLLSENDIIPDPQDYYAAVKELQADTQIKPGNYAFKTLQDPLEVVRQLVDGPNVEGDTLTIPEGLTVSQTAATVEDVYGISSDEFLAQAKASAYVDDYPFLSEAANDSLEGFLCPKTYSFDHTPTADEIIRAMLDQYETETAGLDFDAARQTISSRYGVEMSDYDFLIMASVIEREAITHDQRYNVASTFYNRLAQAMPLQSDATMMYVTGGEVTAEDLKQESPYNTYLNQGLPPTPICAPSLDSLTAALQPADTNYLYFFITQDNEYFSETYDQHLQAIEENQ